MFIDRGIEAISMRETAKKINYSATTLYHHFADKEALLQAVCDEDFLALASGMRKIMQIPDLIARIQALCKGYTMFALDHPNHYRLMFMTPRAPYNIDITQIQQGSTEQDAYAQLKLVVKRHLMRACSSGNLQILSSSPKLYGRVDMACVPLKLRLDMRSGFTGLT